MRSSQTFFFDPNMEAHSELVCNSILSDEMQVNFIIEDGSYDMTQNNEEDDFPFDEIEDYKKETDTIIHIALNQSEEFTNNEVSF